MSTVAAVITRVRTRLDEAVARKYSDANQLIPYVADAEQWLRNLLVKIPGSERFRARETFTLSAAAETFAVSGLTNRFGEVIELQVLVGGQWWPLPMFDIGHDAELRSIQGGVQIPAYRLLGDNLQFLPTIATARSMAIIQRYKPTIKTAAGNSLETPAEYDDLLVARTLHFALADAGQKNGAFEEEYAARIAEVEAIESQRFQGANTERIRRRASRSLFLCR